MDTSAQLDRTQRILILTGVILPLLALSTEEGFAITAVPQAVAALNGFARYSWPSTSFLLTSTIAMPVFAKLSDLYGRKWFYLLGAALCIGYPLLCGSAGTLPVSPDGMTQIIVASGLLGLAHGSILVLSFTFVGDIFPPVERGRYQGLLAAVVSLPFTVGPSMGGWISDHTSWRWAFYVNAPICAASIAAGYIMIPDFRPNGARRPIDWAGIVCLCGWLVPLLLALTWGGESGWSSAPMPALLIGSALLLALFLLIERRAAEPLVVLGLFRDLRISVVSVSILLMGASVSGIALYLPLFLQGVLGASATRSGIVFGQFVLSIVAANLIGGSLLSRTRMHRVLTVGGSCLAAAGLFLFSRMDSNTTLIEILRNAIVCGVGLGVLMPTYEVLVQNAAPAEMMGVATGSTQFFRAVGGALGLATFGAMLVRIYHLHVDALIPKDTPTALKQAFDNPLQLVFSRPDLHAAVSQVANGEGVLRTLLATSRAGLSVAMHSIFSMCAAAMAISVVLNLVLSATRPPKGRSQCSAIYLWRGREMNPEVAVQQRLSEKRCEEPFK
jgi:MFS family permease